MGNKKIFIMKEKRNIAVTTTESELSPERYALQLKEYFSRYENAIIAYSGGVDSALLAYISHLALGTHMLAVLADSPSLARLEYNSAVNFAENHGIPLKIVQTQEMKDSRYRNNHARRCYYCKTALFEKLGMLSGILEGHGSKTGWPAFYGANKDDLGDYRPGMEAAKEASVRAPYIDLDIDKTTIRNISEYYGLEVAEKPASPCLASRILYGEKITIEKLTQVEKAEDFLRDLGLDILRVRHHGDTARIEVPPKDFEQILGQREKIIDTFHLLGFTYVSMDMEGFRSGSLNATLKPDKQQIL